MKILPLILTLLVILTLALREELRNFRTLKESHISSYEYIVNFRERKWLVEEDNKKAESDKPPANKDNKQPKFTGGKDSYPRELNIYPLIDPEEYTKSPEKSQALFRIVERFLNKQFEKAPLFQSLIERDSQLISHLFEAVREKFSSMEFNVGGKMGWKELSLIKLDDERLQLLFYELLKGEKISPNKLDKVFQRGDYIPIMNALSVDKSGKATRLFTASPTLLEALIPDPKDLPPLLEKRREIRRQLMKKNSIDDKKTILNMQWEEAAKAAGIDLPKEVVSYEVSTTPF